MTRYKKMNINSCYNFLLMIAQAIHGLEQMQHTNDVNSVVTCKGNDVDMLWNVDEEESKISQLQLYFNNTVICHIPNPNDLRVSTSYQGRIERIGKTDFRLKNVSLDDEGNYTMFAVIAWSTNKKMKKIVLRILEPPTDKCACNIQPDFKCELPTSDCGRPTVSLVWKRKQTYEDLGGGNWFMFMNYILQDEEILSCLDGEAMKCVNDSRQFCTNVSIPHHVTERSHEDRSTQQTDSVTVPGFTGTDNDSTVFNKFRDLLIGSFVGTLIIMIVTVSVSSAILYYRGKKFVKKSGHKTYLKDERPDTEEVVSMNITGERQAYHEDANPDIEEAVPMNDTETEIKFQTLQHTTRNPSHDTREAVTMKDSNAENNFQKLQTATHEMKILLNQILEDSMTYKRNATGKSVPMNQCMSDSDTEIELQETDFFPSIDAEEAIPMNDLNIEREFQNLQKAVHHMRNFVSQVSEEFITYPILDTGEAICMKDSNVQNEFLRVQKATHQMMHLFIQIYEEYMTFKMPGKAEIFMEYRNCIQQAFLDFFDNL